jgi:hypothetical protein
MKFNRLWLVFAATLVSLFLESTLLAGWSYEPTSHLGKNRISISDEPVTFKTGPFSCVIQKTQFVRMPNKGIGELRYLSCSTDPDTQVSISVSCSPDQLQYGTLELKRGGKDYGPTLWCDTTLK